MKLAKLSLAAIVAVSTMSSFASAASLEEAIKGVEVNGYVRYRFTDNDNDKKYDNHEFRTIFGIVIPVSDTFKVGADGIINIAENASRDNSALVNNDTLHLQTMWFNYNYSGFDLKAGRMEVSTPWTDSGKNGTLGDGFLATYSLPHWTVGLGAFLKTNIGGYHEKDNMDDNNVYAAGLIGNYDMIKVELWGANYEKIINYAIFGDVAFNAAGFSAQVQFNVNETNKTFMKKTNGDKFHNVLWATKLGYEIAGFSMFAGGIFNDNNQPIYALAADDAQGFIWTGSPQMNGKIANQKDAKTGFVDLGYTYDNYSVFAGGSYAAIDDQKNNDLKLKEWYVAAGYKYNKALKFSAYYSSLLADKAHEKKEENDRIRFEAKYSF